MYVVGGLRVAASPPRPGPPVSLELRVDAPQLVVEQLVVIAELEELRVRVFEQLDRALCGVLRIVDERRVPRRDDEVVGEIGDAVPQHLLTLLDAEGRLLRAQQLSDLLAVTGDQLL